MSHLGFGCNVIRIDIYINRKYRNMKYGYTLGIYVYWKAEKVWERSPVECESVEKGSCSKRWCHAGPDQPAYIKYTTLGATVKSSTSNHFESALPWLSTRSRAV